MDYSNHSNFQSVVILGLKTALLEAENERTQLENEFTKFRRETLQWYSKCGKNEINAMNKIRKLNELKIKLQQELRTVRNELEEQKKEMSDKENDNINLEFKVKELKSLLDIKTELLESFNVKGDKVDKDLLIDYRSNYKTLLKSLRLVVRNHPCYSDHQVLDDIRNLILKSDKSKSYDISKYLVRRSKCDEKESTELENTSKNEKFIENFGSQNLTTSAEMNINLSKPEDCLVNIEPNKDGKISSPPNGSLYNLDNNISNINLADEEARENCDTPTISVVITNVPEVQPKQISIFSSPQHDKVADFLSDSESDKTSGFCDGETEIDSPPNTEFSSHKRNTPSPENHTLAFCMPDLLASNVTAHRTSESQCSTSLKSNESENDAEISDFGSESMSTKNLSKSSVPERELEVIPSKDAEKILEEMQSIRNRAKEFTALKQFYENNLFDLDDCFKRPCLPSLHRETAQNSSNGSSVRKAKETLNFVPKQTTESVRCESNPKKLDSIDSLNVEQVAEKFDLHSRSELKETQKNTKKKSNSANKINNSKISNKTEICDTPVSKTSSSSYKVTRCFEKFFETKKDSSTKFSSIRDVVKVTPSNDANKSMNAVGLPQVFDDMIFPSAADESKSNRDSCCGITSFVVDQIASSENPLEITLAANLKDIPKENEQKESHEKTSSKQNHLIDDIPCNGISTMQNPPQLDGRSSSVRADSCPSPRNNSKEDADVLPIPKASVSDLIIISAAPEEIPESPIKKRKCGRPKKKVPQNTSLASSEELRVDNASRCSHQELETIVEETVKKLTENDESPGTMNNGMERRKRKGKFNEILDSLKSKRFKSDTPVTPVVTAKQTGTEKSRRGRKRKSLQLENNENVIQINWSPRSEPNLSTAACATPETCSFSVDVESKPEPELSQIKIDSIEQRTEVISLETPLVESHQQTDNVVDEQPSTPNSNQDSCDATQCENVPNQEMTESVITKQDHVEEIIAKSSESVDILVDEPSTENVEESSTLVEDELAVSDTPSVLDQLVDRMAQIKEKSSKIVLHESAESNPDVWCVTNQKEGIRIMDDSSSEMSDNANNLKTPSSPDADLIDNTLCEDDPPSERSSNVVNDVETSVCDIEKNHISCAVDGVKFTRIENKSSSELSPERINHVDASRSPEIQPGTSQVINLLDTVLEDRSPPIISNISSDLETEPDISNSVNLRDTHFGNNSPAEVSPNFVTTVDTPSCSKTNERLSDWFYLETPTSDSGTDSEDESPLEISSKIPSEISDISKADVKMDTLVPPSDKLADTNVTTRVHVEETSNLSSLSSQVSEIDANVEMISQFENVKTPPKIKDLFEDDSEEGATSMNVYDILDEMTSVKREFFERHQEFVDFSQHSPDHRFAAALPEKSEIISPAQNETFDERRIKIEEDCDSEEETLVIAEDEPNDNADGIEINKFSCRDTKYSNVPSPAYVNPLRRPNAVDDRQAKISSIAIPAELPDGKAEVQDLQANQNNPVRFQFYRENTQIENNENNAKILTPFESIWDNLKNLRVRRMTFEEDAVLIPCYQSVANLAFFYNKKRHIIQHPPPANFETSNKVRTVEGLIEKYLVSVCESKHVAAKNFKMFIDENSRVVASALVNVAVKHSNTEGPKLKATIKHLANLCVELEPIYRDLSTEVKTVLKSKMFMKNYRPEENGNICMVKFVICLSILYTMLCQRDNDVKSVKDLMFDSLCSLKYRAHPIAFGVLNACPTIFNELSRNCLLTQVILFTLLNHTMERNHWLFKVDEVREMIGQYYDLKLGYKAAEELAKEAMLQFDDDTWVDAIVLLCKRQQFSWSYRNVVMKFLIQIINRWKKHDFNETIVIKTVTALHKILQYCPSSTAVKDTAVDVKYQTYNVNAIVNSLSDLLRCAKGSRELRETVAVALCNMSSLNFDLCSKILIEWEPPEKAITSKTLEEMNLLMKRYKIYAQWLKCLLPKECHLNITERRERRPYHRKNVNDQANHRKINNTNFCDKTTFVKKKKKKKKNKNNESKNEMERKIM